MFARIDLLPSIAALSITVCARSENQNSTPDWKRKEAKTTTSSVGTLAIDREQRHEADVEPPPPPIGDRAARRIATRRAISTINAIAGTRLATSRARHRSAGVSSVPGCRAVDEEIARHGHAEQNDDRPTSSDRPAADAAQKHRELRRQRGCSIDLDRRFGVHQSG